MLGYCNGWNNQYYNSLIIIIKGVSYVMSVGCVSRDDWHNLFYLYIPYKRIFVENKPPYPQIN